MLLEVENLGGARQPSLTQGWDSKWITCGTHDKGPPEFHLTFISSYLETSLAL